jgi:hypothetical protein
VRKVLTLIVTLLVTTTIRAQVPQKMSYQELIHDAGNHFVTNQVGMQISILQGTSEGTPVYVETQTPTPNKNGLVTIEIGGGTPVSTGTFAAIDWSAGPYFIKTETDPTGGTSYSLTATSQILSVPYALYAETTGGHYIGEFFGGGIVVAVSKTADVEHGLIASLTNLGPDPGSPWCDPVYMTQLIGPTAQSPDDGQTNTNAIIAQSLGFPCAAKLCDDYTNPETGTGVYSDWYLPSINELKACFDTKYAITNILGIIDGFRFDNYWSSTENMDNVVGEKTSYFIGFHISILNPGGHKSHLLRVRAVRKF